MRRVFLALIPVVAVSTLLTGCGDQIDQTVDELATRALDAGIRDQLDRLGITLAADPDCTTDFTREGTKVSGGGDCTAETTDGDAVEAAFTGTLEPSGCSGTLTVSVAGEQVVDLDEIPDCSVEIGL